MLRTIPENFSYKNDNGNQSIA